MVKVSFLELILRGIPEQLLMMGAFYVLAQKKFDYPRLILSVFLSSISIYLMRLLPIQFGLNTLLATFIMIVWSILINKIETLKAIQIGIFVMFMEYICEVLNMLVIRLIFKENLNYVLTTPKIKVLDTLPSLLFFIIFIVITRFIMTKKKSIAIYK